MDFPKKQAQRLMPLYLLEYSEKLFENHPDPEAPWGGGGSDYTAGYGIDITNSEISVDTDVIATKNDIPTNYVTTDTYQVITGQKQINNAFIFGDGDHNGIGINADYVNRPLIYMFNDTLGVEFSMGVDDTGTETPVTGAYFSHTDDNGERYYALPHQDAIGINTYTLATTDDIPSLTNYVTTTQLEDALDDYALTTDIPTDVSQLNNDAGYTTQT